MPTSRPPPAGPPWQSTEMRSGASDSASAIAAATESSSPASVSHVANAQLLLEFLALVVGDVGDDDLGAGRMETANGGLAEPTRAADDDRGATH